MAGDSIAVAAAETGVRWDEDGRGGRVKGRTKRKNDQHAVFQYSGVSGSSTSSQPWGVDRRVWKERVCLGAKGERGREKERVEGR